VSIVRWNPKGMRKSYRASFLPEPVFSAIRDQFLADILGAGALPDNDIINRLSRPNPLTMALSVYCLPTLYVNESPAFKSR
jgi:hypothetical protein